MMKNTLNKHDGFTLVEIIIVILLIGVISAIGIPKFIDMTESAKQASEDYTVGAIKEGLHIYEMEQAVQ